MAGALSPQHRPGRSRLRLRAGLRDSESAAGLARAAAWAIAFHHVILRRSGRPKPSWGRLFDLFASRRGRFLKRFAQAIGDGNCVGALVPGWREGPWDGVSVDVQIQITDGDFGDLASLARWLGDERELRGGVRQVVAPIKETELGPTTDMLAVGLSAGGGATVLARSLTTWLQTRKTTAKLTIKSGGRNITLDIDTVHDVQPLLQQLLRAADGE